MNTFVRNSKTIFLSLLFVGIFALCIAPAEAATIQPTCSLYYIHNGVISVTQSDVTIKVIKNDIVGLLWNGINASTAVDGSGKSVATLGMSIVTPASDEVYAYTFSQGGQKVSCSIEIEIVSGSLSINDVFKSGQKLSLTGRAQGVEKVVVAIYKTGDAAPTYKTKSLSVKNEKFSFKMTKALPDGSYTVVLQTTDNAPVALATSTVTIGKVAPVALSSLVVQKIPLLSGGTVKAGSGVAVAYLQVINVGTNPARLTNFSFGQAGNAPATLITGVSITDELGVARGSAGNMMSGTPFVGTNVNVPIVAVLAPKESRLFTVRAIVSPLAVANIGQTMSLSLLSLTSDARVVSALPVSGVVWTISR